MSLGDDFGQRLDLCVRLREILRTYVEGTSLLKELVQNADDAGARAVALCLDWRTHPTGTVAFPKLAQFQGPALLAYNSASFTDSDLRAIQRIGDSSKRETSRGTKTGRFGLGFCSVFHLTDLPCFVSGSQLVMLDPQATHLPVAASDPGKLFDFSRHRDAFEAFPDQWAPFRAFGCDCTNPFPGTLFRLPLRTLEQATTSRISQRSHTPLELRSLLLDFAAESGDLLLFLKHVESIAVMQWLPGCESPSPLFRASIENATASLRLQRAFVSSLSGSPAAAAPQPSCQDYRLDLVTTATIAGLHALAAPEAAPTDPDRAATAATEAEERASWIVCNQIGGGESGALAARSDLQHLRLVPWAGAAARVNMAGTIPWRVGGTRECIVRTADAATTGQQVKGRAYCFLPLPILTGLPVHVNGFFEISSNRRELWTASDDMSVASEG
jgi:sacsin